MDQVRHLGCHVQAFCLSFGPDPRDGILAAVQGGDPAALAGRGITRSLALVIPAAVLTANGLEALLDWLARLRLLRKPALAAGSFVLLAGFNFWLLRDALVNGPKSR